MGLGQGLKACVFAGECAPSLAHIIASAEFFYPFPARTDRKRDLIVKITLDEAEQKKFRGRMAMVWPLSEGEGDQLATDLITLNQDLSRHSTEVDAVIGTTRHHGHDLCDRTIVAALTPWRTQIE